MRKAVFMSLEPVAQRKRFAGGAWKEQARTFAQQIGQRVSRQVLDQDFRSRAV